MPVVNECGRSAVFDVVTTVTLEERINAEQRQMEIAYPRRLRPQFGDDGDDTDGSKDISWRTFPGHSHLAHDAGGGFSDSGDGNVRW